ncbi:MAG: RNA-binding protein [Spirochaetales bacterium]|jgi:RNA recognition motif-containing protein|nr:RNA-binding protein [Spirochaetales bacterium]
MSKKVYVGNMNYATTADQLQQLFGQYGNVLNVNVITDRETNRPKGFAFVEMEDDASASAAISAINNQELDGRNLRVNEANERKPPRRDNFRY